MYLELYQFLIRHKQLPVPGIGTFLLERKPAISDFYNRQINPPAYTIALQKDVKAPSKLFFIWLADALNISDREAIIQFNDFIFNLKKKVSAGEVINWNGVGSLSKGYAGEIKFIPVAKQLFFDQPVVAEKMVREKAEHTIRVGEDERTSTQMTELLNKPTEKRSFIWDFALMATFLVIMFIAWYFSQHGLNMSSAANQKKLTPISPAATYKVIK
ncbi:MAG: hypothetical protein JJE22_14305 [Bacteroidia bacterium]|nr:hypothetical protein [Bacteroidia bacterium]